MSEDTRLQISVLEELKWEPSVTAGHIDVTAIGGVVTLSGHVDSYAKKLAVEAATRRVKGVKAMVEEIVVKLPFDTKRSDEDIAEAAIDRLSWNVSVPKDSVVVKVENGWITLTAKWTGGIRRTRSSRTSARYTASLASPTRQRSNPVSTRPILVTKSRTRCTGQVL